MKISPNAPCPCDSGIKYKKCCQLLHKGAAAPSLEALMRSRYSAYALDLAKYLIATTHPEGSQYQADHASWEQDIHDFSQNTKFVGLKIIRVEADAVTFHAALFADNDDVSFTERSVFRQHNGRWKYYAGTALED